MTGRRRPNRVKRPTVAQLPQVSKSPGVGKDPDLAKHNPLVWGLQHLDLGGDWGWHKLGTADVAALHESLVKLESQKLHLLEARNQVRQIPVSDIDAKAQKRLRQIGLEEADTLWELRLSKGRQRVWGLVEGSTFFALWWDPSHSVCRLLPADRKRKRGGLSG